MKYFLHTRGSENVSHWYINYVYVYVYELQIKLVVCFLGRAKIIQN